MKLSIGIFFCGLLWPNIITAQFILNQRGEALGEEPFFNENLIAEAKIQSIKGFYTYKNGDDAFKPSNDSFEYQFNSKGQLIKSMEIIQKGSYKDSLFHYYSYLDNGLIALCRFAAYGGTMSEHYTYDSTKRVISIAIFKDQYDHRHDSLLSSIKMRTETFTYHLNSKFDYTRYNNYYKPYLQVNTTFDKDSLPFQIVRYYRISDRTETETFKYNENGLLAVRSISKNDSISPVEIWRYRYDQWGNLIEMHLYHNDTFHTDYQIIYDYKTGFLGSLIIKDIAKNQMRILRFTSYSYFQ